MTPDAIKERIVRAFADVEAPPCWCLADSVEGHEPALLAEEFQGKADWRTLDPAFLDSAPGGYGSALSFFSDEAFRFYLPAYLLASLDDKLQRADPTFSLTHRFTDEGRRERINPRRYGERTWFDDGRHKFAVFTQPQVQAIVAYLELMRDRDEGDRADIDQALTNYWLARAGDDVGGRDGATAPIETSPITRVMSIGTAVEIACRAAGCAVGDVHAAHYVSATELRVAAMEDPQAPASVVRWEPHWRIVFCDSEGIHASEEGPAYTFSSRQDHLLVFEDGTVMTYPESTRDR